MVCEKCGAQNEKGAVFCKDCGAPLPLTEGEKGKTGGPGGRRGVILGAAGAIAVLAVILILLLSGRTAGYEKTAEKFLDAVLTADGNALVELMPEEMADVITVLYGNRDNMVKDLDRDLKQVCNLFDQYYSGWKYSCEAVDSEDISDRRLERLQEDYEKYGVEVKEAKNVEVQITIQYDGGKDVETVRIPVICAGKTWYFDFEHCDLEDVFSSSGSTDSHEKVQESSFPSESTEASTASSFAESSAESSAEE